ncbi:MULTISPECIES: CHAT domain-containing protein [Nocardiopsis]|uniref:CHAT domain-containing protein n=2 Tax=Nocardiopsis TaxID=2013 RepID=A0ABT4TR74_9ACTN|nr:MULTISPECIES: CHAT domain-containing protein [Nocardiopsis]MDA2807179.1 CHAT domain-containing protein [Nocardiopsis suaedae]MDA2809905.1 CHAT domain-containing protein [Nocardiopsis endophytica]
MEDLVLSVSEFTHAAGRMRWRWTLSTPTGEPLAGHDVRLEYGPWQFEAFTNLPGYLARTTAPDTRLDQEAKTLRELGEWIAEEVYGPQIMERLGRRRGGAVVRVEVPPEARVLAYRPLEAAVLDGRPLIAHRLVLVWDLAVGEPVEVDKDPVGERLRVLALFSLPEGETALNLRKERRGLERLLEGIARTRGKAVELRVVQYGATLESLQEVVEDGQGWDVLHLSGHGARGVFVLEDEHGAARRVSTGELCEHLVPLARRTRLVVASSCSSADGEVAEQMRLLDLAAPSRASDPPQQDTPDGGDGEKVSALALALARELGCAVVGMRYPVVDDFAIDFSAALYELVVGKANPLGRAMGHAVPRAAADPPTPGCPAISAVTPVLVGAGAAEVELDAPAARTASTQEESERRQAQHRKRSNLPDPGEHFVGRGALMARAHRLLHHESGVPGAVFLGMAGAGKTAIATELVWLRCDDFDHVVWFQVPEEGRGDVYGALANLAGEMERKIPGLNMSRLLGDTGKLEAFLPDLTSWFRDESILLVIDNLEPLLTGQNNWKDPRWGSLLAAAMEHQGYGRVVLTSRYRPPGLPDHVRVERVDPLPLDEAVLLARQHPRLRSLFDAYAADPTTDDGELLRRLLVATQGHPKLIELAAARAATPDELAVFLEDPQRVWGGGVDAGAYLAGGEPTAGVEDFTRVLHTWTRRALDGAREAEHLLAAVLACLEDDDCNSAVLDANWGDIWERLGKEGPAPNWRVLLEGLEARALCSTQPLDEEVVRVGVHPEVAAALADHAPDGVPEAVDHELAAYWATLARYMLDNETSGQLGRGVVAAARHALPYLHRTGDTGTALVLIGQALNRDGSAAVRGAMLGWLERLARDTRGTDHQNGAEYLIGVLLLRTSPQEGERRLAALRDRYAAEGDHKQARVVATRLADHYRAQGRLGEALETAEQDIAHSEKTGQGPWTRLADQGRRLQILIARGEHAQVLQEVQTLLEEAGHLPVPDPATETVDTWDVHEGLLDTARSAAVRLERWRECLELTARIRTSQQRRGASELEATRTRFNDYSPLLGLGRLAEAHTLLEECRTVYETHQAWDSLGKVFSAWADLEHRRGRVEQAAARGKDALRYLYRRRPVDPESVKVGHNNLGSYLARGGDVAGGLAHQLAALLLSTLTTGKPHPQILVNTALSLHRLGGAPAPDTFAAVREVVERVDGVGFAALTATFTTPEQAEEVLRRLLADAREAVQHIPAGEEVEK